MMKKEHKIKRGDFPSYHTTKKTWNGSVLRVVWTPKQETSAHTLFTVVVSKKQYHNIPERNLFKRRVFDLLTQSEGTFHDRHIGKCIIYPLHPVRSVTFSAAMMDIQAFLASLSKS